MMVVGGGFEGRGAQNWSVFVDFINVWPLITSNK